MTNVTGPGRISSALSVIANSPNLELEAAPARIYAPRRLWPDCVIPAVEPPEAVDGSWAAGGVSPPASEHAAVASVSAVTRIGRIRFMDQDCERPAQAGVNGWQRVRKE